MNQNNELKEVAYCLRRLADSLIALVDDSNANVTANVKSMDEVSKESVITLEHVRAVFADKSRDGYTAEVRGLLEKHGATKLSEIDPAKYSDLLADAEELGNG
jgi:hypothetical protein